MSSDRTERRGVRFAGRAEAIFLFGIANLISMIEPLLAET